MSNLALNQQLFDDPFKVLFYKALKDYEIESLTDRIEFLDRLADGIHQASNDIKNDAESSGWTGIVSAFGAALSIGAFGVLPVLPVAVLACMSSASAITGIATGFQRKVKLSPVAAELEQP